MRKTLTLLHFVPVLALGQSLVGTAPQNRTAFLEDFTGIHCGYCPEGHVIMADLEAANTTRFSTVGVHAGSFAVPTGNEPDFRTANGATIDAYFTISGYPAGVINRHLFAGENDLGRGAWETAVNDMLALPSPVNLGVESTVDGDQLTVHVVAYYTANSPAGNDYFSVFLKEDHIIGYQADYTNGTHLNYDHLHVLRQYVTDVWGDDIGNHVAGDMVERTYTLTLPSNWNVENLVVGAFVSEYRSEIYQARDVEADGGTTLILGDLTGDAQPYRAGSNGGTTNFDGSFTNQVGADEDYLITLTSDDAPAGWSSGIVVNGTGSGNTTTVSIANGDDIQLGVSITPDPTVGIGTYVLTVASSNTPNAPVLQQRYHIISGVTDLVVTNPQAESRQPIYLNGMPIEPGKAATSRADLIEFGNADALAGVNNLYLNISWTFPSLTDEVVAVVSEFLDNGGNMMIAGQDIGWDQSGVTGTYGTTITQAFFTNYMKATFVADGSSADNQLLFEDADEVFGSVPNGTIANVFAGNTYPDQITPIAPAVPIMRYSTTKIGGLRVDVDGHKVVYFGIGPEQASNSAIGLQMVGLSHDWFYGVVSVEEFDAAMNALGQAYPSPATTEVKFSVGEITGAAALEVFDAMGRVVLTQRVTGGSSIVQLNVESLNNGMYSARLRNEAGNGLSRTFQVMH